MRNLVRAAALGVVLGLSAFMVPGPLTQARSETVIDIFGPSIPRFPVGIFPFRTASPSVEEQTLSREARRILTRDLIIAGFFEILDTSQALADPFRDGFGRRQIDWKVLDYLGADIVVGGTLRVEPPWLRWEVRVYDQPRRRMAFGKVYRGRPQDIRLMVHRFVDELIRVYTGSPGIFQTRIAFLSKRSGNKEIYLTDPDGENVHPLTQDKTIHLSPAWSPDGEELAFISYQGAHTYLYSMDLRSRTRRILSARENLNGPASWAPDGQRLATTLSIHGNPELYLIDRRGAVLRRLTVHPGIDVSPSWSPDGRFLAFVSNRAGGPQIYLLELATGKIRRLTYEGKYNTDPDWSPRGDRIAFSAMIDGNYEICTIRPDGTEFYRLTDSPADDEAPSWSPDGRYLAFSSTRSGSSQIHIMLYNGENPQQITRLPGNQTSPVWSPWPKQVRP